MNTGRNFWQLVGFVLLILLGYGAGELSDAIAAKSAQIESQRLLLQRQEKLLRNNHWDARLQAINHLRKEWMTTLIIEDSAALAKAHLLSDMRNMAQEAGLTNFSFIATESETRETAITSNTSGANTGYKSSGANSKMTALPTGLQMTRLRISSRFEPKSFTKLLHAIENEGRFLSIENVSVRSTQMEINMRFYWRLKNADLLSPITAPAQR